MCSKANITYPCTWGYRIIGHNQDSVLAAIKQVFNDDNVEAKWRFSKNSKYVSLDYHYIVNDDNQRIEYFNKLAQCDKIIMVI